VLKFVLLSPLVCCSVSVPVSAFGCGGERDGGSAGVLASSKVVSVERFCSSMPKEMSSAHDCSQSMVQEEAMVLVGRGERQVLNDGSVS
jgi:hypothetical protein